MATALAEPQSVESAPPVMGPEKFYDVFHRVRRELGKVVVGQGAVIDHLLAAVFGGGHVLLTGMPGLGRTLLVKTLAEVLGLQYRRLQFTPDLLPTDIIGAEVLEHNEATGERNFRFFKGPVFANMLLVDEINRSPTRTQSALLEVMQERQVTSGGQTFFLPKPFTLIATENTLDTEGIWRLGEAQVDRFMMSIEQAYPTPEEEARIVAMTTGSHEAEAERVSTPDEVLAMQSLVREVPVVPSVRDFALAVVRASRPGEEGAAERVADSIRLGASPRAAQALLLGAKVQALAAGRKHVTRNDVVSVVRPVLSHRILLDVRAESEGRDFDYIVEALVEKAQQRSLPPASRWTREILKPFARFGRNGASN
ncbi:MAG: MoxR family ATPase [Planctomycetales bacterium]